MLLWPLSSSEDNNVCRLYYPPPLHPDMNYEIQDELDHRMMARKTCPTSVAQQSDMLEEFFKCSPSPNSRCFVQSDGHDSDTYAHEVWMEMIT